MRARRRRPPARSSRTRSRCSTSQPPSQWPRRPRRVARDTLRLEVVQGMRGDPLSFLGVTPRRGRRPPTPLPALRGRTMAGASVNDLFISPTVPSRSAVACVPTVQRLAESRRDRAAGLPRRQVDARDGGIRGGDSERTPPDGHPVAPVGRTLQALDDPLDGQVNEGHEQDHDHAKATPKRTCSRRGRRASSGALARRTATLRYGRAGLASGDSLSSTNTSTTAN